LVKIVISFFLIVIFGFADTLDDKIKSFIGSQKYYKEQKIINIIIGDKAKYINNGEIDTIRLLKVLRDNGFINLVFKRPKKVLVTFKIKKNTLLFLKIINSSLNAIGFNFYMTKKAIKDPDGFTWSIVMDTENLIDPVYLSNELNKRGCEITDIVKNGNLDWTYTISMQNAKLIAKDVLCDVSYDLKKPIKSYWLGIQGGASQLFVQSRPLNRWHPYVVFFDRGLNILSIYEKDDIAKKLKTDVPKNTKYIMIDDKYTLSNIRSGLKVYISSK